MSDSIRSSSSLISLFALKSKARRAAQFAEMRKRQAKAHRLLAEKLRRFQELSL